MLAGKITLRAVQESDNEFLLKVYGSTREQELAQVPWAAEQKQQFVRMQYQAQKSHYAAQHPHASHEIICLDGTDAGRLYLDRAGEKFHILDITLLPECRNRGAGSFLLGQIMAEAKQAGKPVSIYVETFNPSLKLFQRLGFTPIQQEGFHLLLQCAG
ncbi:MAG: GNAT family N-acetyltransferase [Candidatus Angelobacter sp.]